MKKVLYGILLSLITLGVGFTALSLPFHLFKSLTSREMQLLFIGEVVIYLTVSMAFLVIREKKQERKIKEKEKLLARREKFRRAQEEYYDLAA